MLYSNIIEAFDNPMELQYNTYKNKVFSNEDTNIDKTINKNNYKEINSYDIEKMFSTFDNKIHDKNLFNTQGKLKQYNNTIDVPINNNNIVGTSINDLKNNYKPINSKKHNHKYYANKFINDIENYNIENYDNLHSKFIYDHVSNCKQCKRKTVRHFKKSNQFNIIITILIISILCILLIDLLSRFIK